MPEPITANYARDGDDWTITVTAGDQTRTGRAPGLIAARDRAEQFAEQLQPEPDNRTVVHLLDGDALAFTSTYLRARLGLAEQPADQKS